MQRTDPLFIGGPLQADRLAEFEEGSESAIPEDSEPAHPPDEKANSCGTESGADARDIDSGAVSAFEKPIGLGEVVS